jgi:hypothetical protein
MAIGWKRTRDIGSVTVEFATRIDQDQIPVFYLRPVALIMKNTGITPLATMEP